MLRVRPLALGALILLAGCTTGPQGGVAPGDDCVLGGPPRAPPASRSAFNLTDEHIERYPSISEIFSNDSHVVELRCEEGLDILEDLAAEGADVRFDERAYNADTYLRYDGTVLRVALQTSL